MKTTAHFLRQLATVVLVSASFTLTRAQSELVFEDNFNLGLGTTDINEGVGGARQSGTAGATSYLESDVTGPEGGLPFFTEIFDGRLYLWVNDNGEVQPWTWVSPDRNFIDGPVFTIEFDLDPSVLDIERTSDDWAAIVLGATAPGQYVNASDGVGILFRSTGAIQVFDGAQLVHDTAPETPLPAGEVHVRIEVTGQDFSGATPATVALFINDVAVPLDDGGDAYARPAGFRGNHLTLQGYAAPGNEWQYTFDNLTVRANTCVRLDPQEIQLDGPPAAPLQLALKVPPNFNGGQGGAVTLSSSNPGVVTIAGAQDNQLTLNFAAGGPSSQTVTIEVVGSGRARILLATDAPDCVGEPAVIVTPLASNVRNPSFESNYNATWPHYSPVDDWTGGSGVNRSDGPFHDNGVVPDRAQIAFLQGTSAVSQMLTGLEPGRNYWLQVRYNSRNCCGGETPDMTVSVDGTALGTEMAILPSGTVYYFRNFEFVPGSDTALLEISTQPNGGGDSTLLIDAVTVIQRDAGNVVVQNPSFEASGVVPLPGVFTTERIAGWQGQGTFGLNLAGDPFADNGITPHENQVAFVQGAGSLAQTLTGLIPGETYQVDFAYNARSGDTPHLRVTANEASLLEVDVVPVGNGAYHEASVSFLADTASAVLRFAQTTESDQTLLLDDVRVIGQAINLPCIQIAPEQVQLSVGQTSAEVTVKLLEDVVANGPATVTVTSTDPAVASLPGAVNGTLTLTFQPGEELVQTVPVMAIGAGTATLEFSESRGVCFDKPGISVLVLRGFVRNPSFEANSHPSYPGYGPIAGWSSEGPGNTGINNVTGPFHDNGGIPDRDQVALLQTSKIIRQEIVNLTPGARYWLQFYYNVRNCCGGAIDLTVRFAGSELRTFPAIQPVLETNAYHFAHVEFTAGGGSGFLEFETVAAGDATVLLDAITIVQRAAGDVVLRNPSFEASGQPPLPGYITGAIAGWSSGGAGRGVNISGVGPLADNGGNPDQDNVLFLQGAGTFVSQVLEGLTPGQNYTVRFGANASTGTQPVLEVSFDDYIAPSLPVSPVGGSNPYSVLEVVVPATAAQGVLRFEQTAAGDHTLLMDNVVVVPGGTLPEPAASLSISQDAEGAIRLSWPASAADFQLQSTTALPDGWADAPEPVVIEGDQRVVTLVPAGDARYFRLRN